MAEATIVMARPGKTPRVRKDERTVTFVMPIVLRSSITRDLVIRCERDGSIYVSIGNQAARKPTESGA
jgi:hypothetical protein